MLTSHLPASSNLRPTQRMLLPVKVRSTKAPTFVVICMSSVRFKLQSGENLSSRNGQACPGMLWVEVDEVTLPFLELVIGTEQHVRVGGQVEGQRLAR